jgi:hypothetical protein
MKVILFRDAIIDSDESISYIHLKNLVDEHHSQGNTQKGSSIFIRWVKTVKVRKRFKKSFILR